MYAESFFGWSIPDRGKLRGERYELFDRMFIEKKLCSADLSPEGVFASRKENSCSARHGWREAFRAFMEVGGLWREEFMPL